MFTIEKVEVKANPDKQLSSDWTIEETQDLKAHYGINLERWLMYPNGAPWYIKLRWFFVDLWYGVRYFCIRRIP